MACTGVELSPPTAVTNDQPERNYHLHPCPECGAPMLLMSATEALRHPITLRKTYQCMVCECVEVQVAPLFD
jgi:hypothetical protein